MLRQHPFRKRDGSYPYQSVTIDKEGKPYVFVIDNSQHRAKKRHIEPGISITKAWKYYQALQGSIHRY
jgi:hypothetical protein